MSSSPPSRFAAYTDTLKRLSVRTGTPLPSLLLSFGILHEITAVVPLIAVFYGARTLGIGESAVSAIVRNDPESSTVPGVGWVTGTLQTWVKEGDAWAGRVGRRYGVFGFEKRISGSLGDGMESSQLSNRVAGDVANAIVAYGVTKVNPNFCTICDI